MYSYIRRWNQLSYRTNNKDTGDRTESNPIHTLTAGSHRRVRSYSTNTHLREISCDEKCKHIENHGLNAARVHNAIEKQSIRAPYGRTFYTNIEIVGCHYAFECDCMSACVWLCVRCLWHILNLWKTHATPAAVAAVVQHERRKKKRRIYQQTRNRDEEQTIRVVIWCEKHGYVCVLFLSSVKMWAPKQRDKNSRDTRINK